MELILVQHVLPERKQLSTGAGACAAARSVITIDETSHLLHTGLPAGMFQKG